jgi:hypothetical protein
MDSVMFNEALQDLKDRYPSRLTLIHILSRQAQEVPLLEGRIDAAKVQAIIDAFLPVGSMDEVFVCGPEAMIEATEQALLNAGVKPERIRSERFSSPTLDALTPEARANAVLGKPDERVTSSTALRAKQAKCNSPWCWTASPTTCRCAGTKKSSTSPCHWAWTCPTPAKPVFAAPADAKSWRAPPRWRKTSPSKSRSRTRFHPVLPSTPHQRPGGGQLRRALKALKERPSIGRLL